jgi:hypothetical protein
MTLMEMTKVARPNLILSSELGKERTAIPWPNWTGVAGELAQCSENNFIGNVAASSARHGQVKFCLLKDVLVWHALG